MAKVIHNPSLKLPEGTLIISQKVPPHVLNRNSHDTKATEPETPKENPPRPPKNSDEK